MSNPPCLPVPHLDASFETYPTAALRFEVAQVISKREKHLFGRPSDSLEHGDRSSLDGRNNADSPSQESGRSLVDGELQIQPPNPILHKRSKSIEDIEHPETKEAREKVTRSLRGKLCCWF